MPLLLKKSFLLALGLMIFTPLTAFANPSSCKAGLKSIVLYMGKDIEQARGFWLTKLENYGPSFRTEFIESLRRKAQKHGILIEAKVFAGGSFRVSSEDLFVKIVGMNENRSAFLKDLLDSGFPIEPVKLL